MSGHNLTEDGFKFILYVCLFVHPLLLKSFFFGFWLGNQVTDGTFVHEVHAGIHMQGGEIQAMYLPTARGQKQNPPLPSSLPTKICDPERIALNPTNSPSVPSLPLVSSPSL